MERRRSVAIAAGGLLAAIAFFLLGRPSSDDLRAAVTDLDALIRETAAGVQARAETLAQLPRLGWAVATDETTVHDLTTEELAFQTHPGEHIEITQIRKAGGEARRLLRLPAGSDLQLPVVPGTRVVVRADQAQVVTVVSVEPRERADELIGILAVAKQLDTSAIQKRLAARGINAELRTAEGSLALAGRPVSTSSIGVKLPLAGPAAAGATIVAANVGRARWPRIVSPFILVLSLVAASLQWRRVAGPPARALKARPPARPATAPPRAPPTAPVSARPPIRSVPLDDGNAPPRPPATPPTGRPSATTPPVGTAANRPPATPPTGRPSDPAAPLPLPSRARSLTGRVEIMLARSGSVPVSPQGTGRANDPNADADPRTEEYRSLFVEFVKLRRTTGEPVEGLEVRQFIQTLREKRAQIMKQIPVKDVRFKLAFQNGKAAIRYQTVT